jgi:hypothetical protein
MGINPDQEAQKGKCRPTGRQLGTIDPRKSPASGQCFASGGTFPGARAAPLPQGQRIAMVPDEAFGEEHVHVVHGLIQVTS